MAILLLLSKTLLIVEKLVYECKLVMRGSNMRLGKSKLITIQSQSKYLLAPGCHSVEKENVCCKMQL